MDSLITYEFDEILDQLYSKIKQFLHTKVGEDLDQDLIDISLETTENGELIVNIDLYLELSPFSNFNVQEVAEEAVKHGIKEADQICPYVIKIQNKQANQKK
ncbi:MAG: DUF3194 domain-containing protein [Candidatus Heimdallarchaeota archaeon]|nr:MAG: DUF3194 domain-containing protein [Candidatus Heimdallarchaeota archaeon]